MSVHELRERIYQELVMEEKRRQEENAEFLKRAAREEQRRSYPRSEMRELADGVSMRIPLDPGTRHTRSELRESGDWVQNGPYLKDGNYDPYPDSFHVPPADARIENGPLDGERRSISPDWRSGHLVYMSVQKPLQAERVDLTPGQFNLQLAMAEYENHQYELHEWIERFDPDDEDTPPMHRHAPFDIKEHYWIWMWKGKT
jgi:hypothetical protein